MTRDNQVRIVDLSSDTRDINKLLGRGINYEFILKYLFLVKMSNRDIRRLPQDAIDAAKRARNPWNL